MPTFLRTLRVRDLVIIEDLTIEFSRGLNLLTGETGAGKSILVDALGLVSGARGDRGLVRSGASRAVVEALFEIGPDTPAAARLADVGVELEPDERELVVRRELAGSGSGRVSLNGSPATVAMLRELGPTLIELHGQHEQQHLLSADYQSRLLDEFGGHGELLARTAAAHAALREVCARQSALGSRAAARAERQADLERIAREIEAVAPRPDELVDLGRERVRLRNAGRIADLVARLAATVHEDEPSAAGLAASAARLAEDLGEIDADVVPLAERARSAALELEDLGTAFRDYRDREGFDPGRLDEVESRLAAIEALTLRYGDDETGLALRAEQARHELGELASLDAELAEAAAARERAARSYEQAAGKLGRARGRAGRSLSRKLAEQLAVLALPEAVFRVDLVPLGGPGGPRGAERAEFRIATNAGEPAGPLAQVASGGELSRIMLGLHVVAGQQSAGRVLVFDEVDTGVGGAVADAVGARLAELGRREQVLCVTHLPQVAAYADRHFRVHKQVRAGRTRADVVGLSARNRIEELARMLGGKRPTDSSRRHAATLLEAAGRPAGSRPGRRA